MQKYRDIDRDSGVDSYLIIPTAIKVKFKSGPKVYVYTYSKPGSAHVDKMKTLAESGDGLNAYINKYVQDKYDHLE